MDHFVEITEQVGTIPQYLDVGGGFGSPVHDEDCPIDTEELNIEINTVFSMYMKKFPKSTYLFESGRYIVGGSGVFLTRVCDVKKLFGIKYVILDGGINCYGGFARTSAFRPPPIRVLSEKRALEIVTLCGPLCTPFDILANNIELPTVNVGDLIAIYNAGAYNFSASPANFLSFKQAHEVCIE